MAWEGTKSPWGCLCCRSET